jgi:hypothetical protein
MTGDFDAFKNGGDSGEPPDGIHTATLQATSVFESKAGAWWVRTCWQTADRAHYWESLHGTEGGAKQFTLRLLAAIGVNLEALGSWDALGDELATVEGGLYTVKVTRRGDFLNTEIEGRPQGVQTEIPVQTPAAPAPASSSAIFGDDDIPF